MLILEIKIHEAILCKVLHAPWIKGDTTNTMGNTWRSVLMEKNDFNSVRIIPESESEAGRGHQEEK